MSAGEPYDVTTDLTMTILTMVVSACLLFNAIAVVALLFTGCHYFRRLTMENVLIYLYLLVENADMIQRNNFD